MAKKQYFCIVFFMVLDLRLNEKVGLSGDNLLFWRKIHYFCIFFQKNLVNSKKSSTFALPFENNGVTSRSRAVVARQAHNLKVGGSIPSSATKFFITWKEFRKQESQMQWCMWDSTFLPYSLHGFSFFTIYEENISHHPRSMLRTTRFRSRESNTGSTTSRLEQVQQPGSTTHHPTRGMR